MPPQKTKKQNNSATRHPRFISSFRPSKVKSWDSWRFAATEVSFIMSRDESRRLTNNSGNKSLTTREERRGGGTERVSQDGVRREGRHGRRNERETEGWRGGGVAARGPGG